MLFYFMQMSSTSLPLKQIELEFLFYTRMTQMLLLSLEAFLLPKHLNMRIAYTASPGVH